MSTKSICLDIDGVITNIGNGIESFLSKKNIHEYDYSHWLFEKYEDDLTLEIFNNKPFWLNLKPFEDAWYQTNYWWSSGYDVHLVTARYSQAGKEVLMQWLDAWKIGYSSVHIAELNNKKEVLLSLNPLFMVEDNYNEISSLEDCNVKCFMRKHWYNKDYWSKYNSIDTLFDIKEIDA